jgi:hypothetical protein
MADNDKISLEKLLSEAAGSPTSEDEDKTVTKGVEGEQDKDKQERDKQNEEEQDEEDKDIEKEDEEEQDEEDKDAKEEDEEDVAKKKAEEKKAAEDAAKKKPKVNPMKEVRDKFNTEKSTRQKIETIINKFTDGDYSFKLKDFRTEDGFDYEALDAAMQEADTKEEATKKGITPEVQAEIERIEKEKIEINKQRLQIGMDKALTELQLSRNIRSAEINQFFKDAMAIKKNPYQWLAQGGDLDDLYFLLYREKLIKARIDKAVEDARSKWDSESSRNKKIPAANPAQKTQAKTESGEGLTFEALLEEAAKKQR